jgi:hypothetical protein
MKQSRRTRFLTALVALFSQLFMQLAVAAYACPKLAPVQQRAVIFDASGQTMVDCPNVDKQNPSLCQAHSQKAAQSIDKAEPPSIQPFTALGLIMHVAMPEAPEESGSGIAAVSLQARSTAPPISIRNCCFRL